MRRSLWAQPTEYMSTSWLIALPATQALTDPPPQGYALFPSSCVRWQRPLARQAGRTWWRRGVGAACPPAPRSADSAAELSSALLGKGEQVHTRRSRPAVWLKNGLSRHGFLALVCRCLFLTERSIRRYAASSLGLPWQQKPKV